MAGVGSTLWKWPYTHCYTSINVIKNVIKANSYSNKCFFNEIKLPKIQDPYGYKDLQKIQEKNKDKVLFNVFNLN